MTTTASDLGAVRAEIEDLQNKTEAITARCAAESRSPHPDEASKLRHYQTKLGGLLDRASRLEIEEVARSQRILQARMAQLPPESSSSTVPGSTVSVSVTGEPLTYQQYGPNSYFKDLYQAQRFNDPQARNRLQRHVEEMRVEKRDLSSTDGSGGDFIPPLWVDTEWIPAVRASRPFADAVTNLPLPENTDTINFPKVLTGSATAAHADLGAVQETDPTTGSVSIPVKTIAGQVDVSRQAIDRSTPGLDRVLLGDLASDYALRLDLQTLTGSGSGANAKGVLSDSNRITITWTQASPTVRCS
jgi:HK97 family phage major capsid protein